MLSISYVAHAHAKGDAMPIRPVLPWPWLATVALCAPDTDKDLDIATDWRLQKKGRAVIR